MTYLASQGVTDQHPLYEVRETIKSRLLIVVATDKGLAGAYDSNVLKLYTKQLLTDDKDGVANETIAIGRRANRFVSKLKATKVIAAHQDLPDDPAGSQLRAIVDQAIEKFESGEVDAVDIVFTEYISSVNQTATTQRILPAGYEKLKYRITYVKPSLSQVKKRFSKQ